MNGPGSGSGPGLWPKARSSALGLGSVLKDTFQEWYKDDCPQWSAALAYYIILSFAPLMVVIVALTGVLIPPGILEGDLAGEIEHFVGRAGAEVIQDVLASAREPNLGVLPTSLGVGMLLWGASSAFSQLQKTLNHIWHVPATPETGWVEMVVSQLLAIGMVLVVGLLLLISLLLSSTVAAINTYATVHLPSSIGGAHLLEELASWLMVSLLFALILKWLPNVRVPWSAVLLGAGVTGVLFIIGKSLIGWYLGYAAIGSAYGAASSLIALLVWIYYSTQVFFLGAEFTKALVRRRNTQSVRTVPKPRFGRSP